jgi:hypothetical protein
MSGEARELLRSWHRVQKSASSCVAACRAIVEARYGWEGIEVDAAGLIGGEFLHEDIAESVVLIEARLKRGASAIVGVRGPVWMELARAANSKIEVRRSRRRQSRRRAGGHRSTALRGPRPVLRHERAAGSM